jgi:hypothetical protein
VGGKTMDSSGPINTLALLKKMVHEKRELFFAWTGVNGEQ